MAFAPSVSSHRTPLLSSRQPHHHSNALSTRHARPKLSTSYDGVHNRLFNGTAAASASPSATPATPARAVSRARAAGVVAARTASPIHVPPSTIGAALTMPSSPRYDGSPSRAVS